MICKYCKSDEFTTGHCLENGEYFETIVCLCCGHSYEKTRKRTYVFGQDLE